MRTPLPHPATGLAGRMGFGRMGLDPGAQGAAEEAVRLPRVEVAAGHQGVEGPGTPLTR